MPRNQNYQYGNYPAGRSPGGVGSTVAPFNPATTMHGDPPMTSGGVVGGPAGNPQGGAPPGSGGTMPPGLPPGSKPGPNGVGWVDANGVPITVGDAGQAGGAGTVDPGAWGGDFGGEGVGGSGTESGGDFGGSGDQGQVGGSGGGPTGGQGGDFGSPRNPGGWPTQPTDPTSTYGGGSPIAPPGQYRPGGRGGIQPVQPGGGAGGRPPVAPGVQPAGPGGQPARPGTQPAGAAGNPAALNALKGLQNQYQNQYQNSLNANKQLYAGIMQGYAGTGQRQVAGQQGLSNQYGVPTPFYPVVQGYLNQMDTAGQQQQQGQAGVQNRYDTLQKDVLAGIQGISKGARQDIEKMYTQQSGQQFDDNGNPVGQATGGATMQNAASRGLGNTTVVNSLQRGDLSDFNKSKTQLAGQTAALNAGYQSTLGGAAAGYAGSAVNAGTAQANATANARAGYGTQVGLAGLGSAERSIGANTALDLSQYGFMGGTQIPYPSAQGYGQLAGQLGQLAGGGAPGQYGASGGLGQFGAGGALGGLGGPGYGTGQTPYPYTGGGMAMGGGPGPSSYGFGGTGNTGGYPGDIGGGNSFGDPLNMGMGTDLFAQGGGYYGGTG